jgi:ribosomal protein S27E
MLEGIMEKPTKTKVTSLRCKACGHTQECSYKNITRGKLHCEKCGGFVFEPLEKEVITK